VQYYGSKIVTDWGSRKAFFAAGRSRRLKNKKREIVFYGGNFDMTTKTQINLQDAFLNQVRKESIPVTIFLVNGFQLKGVVRGFDNFTVIMESEGRQMMVYKHAISTVSPVRPVNTSVQDSKANG
jgi:host factor-I protein